MDSPFAHQLGTNYCPTDQELLEIRGLLVEPALQMERLDDEIVDLQKTLGRLAEERAGLDAFMEAHKALISPVRRLPLDIVQEIFLACLPTRRNCAMSASEAPILLGRICGSWRAISLSTPRLWAKLHVVRPSRPPPDAYEFGSFERKCAQRLEMLQTWLRRSSDCALSVSLDEGVDYGADAAPREYLHELLTFASRWREIKVTSQAPMLRETLSRLAASDVPLLQDLEIYERPVPVDPDPSLPNTTWASVAILGSRRLSRLSLSAGDLSPTRLPVAWGQLTSLTLADLVWNSPNNLTDRAIHVLSQCPALRFCRFTVLDPVEWTPENRAVGSIVECPFLDEMSLSCLSIPAFTIPRIFRRLSLPQLRKFLLRGFSGPESHDALSFSSFLAVATRLEILDISAETFSKASLLELIHGLPTLRRLHLKYAWASQGMETPFDDDILKLLTPALLCRSCFYSSASWSQMQHCCASSTLE
ncbi:hypothetical protein DFH06DRAFT_1222836 [Mycena polygramma]|nr:hypothetical protein DFH06DRAFT_1222836 [Mycena polygramma]